MSRLKKNSVTRYIQVASTFGISTALRIYVLGIWGGGWLDRKFGTVPWFMLAGILLAIFLSFKFLLDQLSRAEKNGSKKGEE